MILNEYGTSDLAQILTNELFTSLEYSMLAVKCVLE